MAKKIDVFNAYYEGVFLAVSVAIGSGDTILQEIDHLEAIEFLDSDAGAEFRGFVEIDRDQQRIFAIN